MWFVVHNSYKYCFCLFPAWSVLVKRGVLWFLSWFLHIMRRSILRIVYIRYYNRLIVLWRFFWGLGCHCKNAWNLLNIQPNRFIRTTDQDHKSVVTKFIKKCNSSGDIYKGIYEGLYCTDCEAYYTEKDAPDLSCPVHKKPLEKLKEESYFFKLSKYQNFLLELYKKHPEYIQPKEKRNEIINRVKEGLKDFSITRTSFNWGIPFPLEKNHIVYVWFDALINYYTATQTPKNSKLPKPAPQPARLQPPTPGVGRWCGALPTSKSVNIPQNPSKNP